eukprot:GGOE01017838.1.p1 GENE.GGOE01017838.1~~GGOE01017838.1.p1  ORF type:complete len:533 (+),score=102.65 GGOE01017838.1:97-1599(+)
MGSVSSSPVVHLHICRQMGDVSLPTLPPPAVNVTNINIAAILKKFSDGHPFVSMSSPTTALRTFRARRMLSPTRASVVYADANTPPRPAAHPSPSPAAPSVSAPSPSFSPSSAPSVASQPTAASPVRSLSMALVVPPAVAPSKQPLVGTPKTPTPTPTATPTPTPIPRPSPRPGFSLFVTNTTLCDTLDQMLTGRQCLKASDAHTAGQCHTLHTQCYLHQPYEADIYHQFPLNTKEVRSCGFTFRGTQQRTFRTGRVQCGELFIPKFFAESRLSSHLDARWGKSPLPASQLQRAELFRTLFHAWSNFTHERGLRYLLFAGSLVGWFFNKDILPWDDDLDVLVLATDLLSPDRYMKYDRTTYNDRYYLEVNPRSAQRAPDARNIIDGRFFDKTTGIFIDIVAVSYNPLKKILQCKQGQPFDPAHLFPCRRTTFMGARTWVPYNVSQFLIAKYSRNVTRRSQPQRHHTTHCPRTGPCELYYFNTATNQWIYQPANQSSPPAR